MANENEKPLNNQTEEDNVVNITGEEELQYDSFSEDLDDQNIDTTEQSLESSKLQGMEAELATMKDQLIRALAEAENTRKRAQKDREDASKFAISNFARDLLSVADNLRRALDSVAPEMVESQPQIKNLTDGIEATERELLRTFEKNGIKKIEPLEEPFNPNFHEVMFEAPVPNKPNGTIIQILEAGYILNDRILRPARVGISKNETGDQSHQIDTEV